MRVLVIGATGFVGSHVLKALREAGHEVSGFKRPSSALDAVLGLELEWWDGDLADPASLRPAMRGKDAVVFAAGLLSSGRSRNELYEANVVAARNVARACLEARARLLYCGSAATYAGSSRLEPVDESGVATPERFSSFQVVSMALGEAEILKAIAAGLDAVRLLPLFVVGPGDLRGHAGWLFSGPRVTLCPPGGLNLVGVEDVARAHVLALAKAKPGSCYLLGGENLTNRALLDLLSDMLDRRPLVVPVPRGGYRALEEVAGAVSFLRRNGAAGSLEPTLYWFLDPSRAEAELGWKAASVRDALHAQLEWERAQLD